MAVLGAGGNIYCIYSNEKNTCKNSLSGHVLS